MNVIVYFGMYGIVEWFLGLLFGNTSLSWSE